MDTVTADYAALNRELHERSKSYGSGAWRKADAIVEIVVNNGFSSVLDYGCGKGTLAAELENAVPVAEYDPAIEGKDGPPEPADLVVCLDVLEHVEPDKLEATIKHLHSLTLGELLVTIACRPSTATLADGRNAHLIIEPPEWWAEKFAPLRWRVLMWRVSSDRGELWARLKPLHEVGHIKAKMAITQGERDEQVLQNIGRVSRRLTHPGVELMPDNGRRAVLCCFGPSLQTTWAAAALANLDADTDVFTVSAAHRFMLDRGVIPLAHIDCDPRPHKITPLGPPHPDVEYWLASCIHPDYIDHVAGGKSTALWHAYNGEDSMDVLLHEPGQRMVVGGGSVGLRSMSLLYYLGYRHIEIHGMDCSFRETGKQWAGEHHGKIKSEVTIIMPDGREFLTAPAMILYYRYFFKQLSWMPDCVVNLHGDGMLQHRFKLQNADRAAAAQTETPA